MIAKKCLCLITILGVVGCSAVYAISTSETQPDIISVVPSSTAPITVTSSGTTTVFYTATATAAVQHIGIDTGFNMPTTLITTSLQSDHCSGQSLTPPETASCTFSVVLQGVSGQSGPTTLMPRVSVNGGANYVIPHGQNQIAVTVK